MEPDRRLLQLLDHPPRGTEPARDPAFTAAVMTRVRRDAAPRVAAARPLMFPWWLAGAALLAFGCFLPGSAFTDDSLGEAAQIVPALSPGLVVELAASALGAGALLLIGRKWLV